MIAIILMMTSCQSNSDQQTTVGVVTDSPKDAEKANKGSDGSDFSQELTEKDSLAKPSENVSQTSDLIGDNAQKAIDLVCQQVPELAAYDQHISENSDGKAFLIVNCKGRAKDLSGIVANIDLSGSYYMVYVGEQWEDHRVNWDWFFVSEDFSEVLWYYLPESEVYTLDDWRNNSHYRTLSESDSNSPSVVQ
jgi:hypothetical protein